MKEEINSGRNRIYIANAHTTCDEWQVVSLKYLAAFSDHPALILIGKLTKRLPHFQNRFVRIALTE
jgi:hypothetical protein